jgi:pimeloyl-ACP methyl ester carboxylesterase
MLFDSVATRIDQLVLYSMHRRMPESFRHIDLNEPTFEQVLAATAVDHRQTPAYSIYAPGERPVVLRSMGESLNCCVNVRLHPDPTAPLLIYHHGFSETPYNNSWQRIFRQRPPFPLSTVCIRAPFHSHWREPFREAFASVRRIYQTFAGSLRLIELVQRQFEAEGAAFSVLAGVSWGGITSMLYAGQFGGVRAVAPMLSSPNLAQVVWDAAEMVGTDVTISRQQLDELLDFTPRCEYDAARVFPLMGDTDVFFRLDKHANHYSSRPVVVHRAHVFSLYGVKPLRDHIYRVVEWAGADGLSR